MDPSDWDLVQRAKAGDSRAFHALVDRHAPGLYQLAAMMTRNTADAQDIVQETLLGAFQGLGRFEGSSAVRTWLVSILVRQVASHRRRQSIRKTTSLDAEGAPTPVDRRAQEPASQVDARIDLGDLLARLPEDQRQIIALRELEGLSYAQIAQMLDLPQGTVESRLFRARQTLKQLAK